jgi:hypothetical protein
MYIAMYNFLTMQICQTARYLPELHKAVTLRLWENHVIHTYESSRIFFRAIDIRTNVLQQGSVRHLWRDHAQVVGIRKCFSVNSNER